MQIVRTVVWVLLLVGLLLFSIANWDPTVTVRIWEGIVVDTKIPAIVIVAFAIGFVPIWLYHRASKWRLTRKIQSLENAARTAAATPIAPREAGETAARPEPRDQPDLATDTDTDTDTALKPQANENPPAGDSDSNADKPLP